MGTSVDGASQADEHQGAHGLVVLTARVATWINFSGAALVVSTLAFMFVTIFINVILRYFFGSGLTWAYEMPSILFPWAVAGGMVMAAAQGRNITVDIAMRVLPSLPRRVLLLLINLFMVGTCVGVVYYAWPIIHASRFARLAETGIAQIYGYSSLLYAFSMIAVISTLTTLQYLFGRSTVIGTPSESSYS